MDERDALIERLYDAEYERLMRKAFRLTGDAQRSQDLVQETFSFALVHYKELLTHPRQGAWLSTVLFNLAMNDRRLWDNSRNVSMDQLGDIFPAKTPSNLFEIMPEGLSEDEKQMLVLRFEQHLSYREIAGMLGISEAASRTRMSRLLKKVRKLF